MNNEVQQIIDNIKNEVHKLVNWIEGQQDTPAPTAGQQDTPAPTEEAQSNADNA